MQHKVHVGVCVQHRLESVWISALSDQSLSFLPEEALDSWLRIEHPSKTLIRLSLRSDCLYALADLNL